jgi:hypothetical protein
VRWLALALLALALPTGAVAAGDKPIERVVDKVHEALRLERIALEIMRADWKDPEADTHLATAAGLLRDALAVPGADIPDGARKDLRQAQKTDELLVRDRQRLRPEFAIFVFAISFLQKAEALDIISYSAWRADESKHAAPVRVSPPACRSLAQISVPGCTGVDIWDVYVDKDAKRARCTFRGPAGELLAARPLFPGTAQRKTCKLAGFRTVDGVRKRVVHAELHITALPGTKTGPPRTVTVTAHWQ